MTKPKFVADAGFGKKGAIVDGDDGTEYVRTFIDRVVFNLKLTNSTVTLSKNPAAEGDEVDTLTKFDREILDIRGDDPTAFFDRPMRKNIVRDASVSGIATVASDVSSKWNYGYRFSAFGSQVEFVDLEVSIHKSQFSRCAIHYFEKSEEYNLAESFSIEISLPCDAFDELLANQIGGNSNSYLSILCRDPRFYASWSPIANEGRLIKYLDPSSNVLEDSNDLLQSLKSLGPMNLQFKISIVQKIVDQTKSGQNSGSPNDNDNGPIFEEFQKVDRMKEQLDASIRSVSKTITKSAWILGASILIGSWLSH